MLVAGVLALFLAILLFFVGGRSAMLTICNDSTFACTIRDAAGYLFGPVGWLGAAGVLLLLGAGFCLRQAQLARP